MKTTQYAVKVKTFYNIIIADIVQYFDFIKIVFRACLHSVLSRDGDESQMNSKRNLDVVKSEMNSKRKINVAKKIYICFKHEHFRHIFSRSPNDVSLTATVLEKRRHVPISTIDEFSHSKQEEC